ERRFPREDVMAFPLAGHWRDCSMVRSGPRSAKAPRGAAVKTRRATSLAVRCLTRSRIDIGPDGAVYFADGHPRARVLDCDGRDACGPARARASRPASATG